MYYLAITHKRTLHSWMCAVLLELNLSFAVLFFFVCLVSRPVNARLCEGAEPPSAVQNCSIPCQNHCLLTQWSHWSACLHENCKDPQGKKGKLKYSSATSFEFFFFVNLLTSLDHCGYWLAYITLLFHLKNKRKTTKKQKQNTVILNGLSQFYRY